MIFVIINGISYFLFVNNNVKLNLPNYEPIPENDEIKSSSQEIFWSTTPERLSKTSKDFEGQPVIAEINFITDYFAACCVNHSEFSGQCTYDGIVLCSDKKLSNSCTCVEKDYEDEQRCCTHQYGQSNYCYQGQLICNDGKLSRKCRC